MTRRRLTWTDRKASAAPAMPGYQEPSIHPAAYPDPEADAYENGDTSAWAEDPHPGPYTNPMHPALPGTEAPMGHPATDPAHYFPAGVSKQASRQVRAAMEAKAAKCIRIATAMLGRKASVSAIEDQALDLMNLTERQIQAALRRVAEEQVEADDLLGSENYTLTPPRTAEDDELEGMSAEEELLASMLKEEGRKASRRAAQMPGGQNSPEHYNYREQGVLASKKSEEDVESEEMLADMVKEESKKASLKARAAKKSEEDDVDAEDEAKLAEMAKEEKKASLAEMLAGEEPMADDLMMDMGMDDMSMDEGMDEGMGMDDMSALYGMSHYAKKSEESEETAEEEEEAPAKEAKKAAVRPQPRLASNGVRTLGAVSKVASSDVNDLSKLWESAPDVSKIFG